MRQTDVAKILNISKSTVSRAVRNETIGDKNDKVRALLEIENTVQDLMRDEELRNMCEFVLDRCRKKATIKYAALLLNLLTLFNRGQQ